MRKQELAGPLSWVAALSLLIVMAVPQPVAAKSLFESIFGFLGPKPSSNARPRVITRPKPGNNAPRYHPGRANPFVGANRARRQSVRSSGGRYKTVCVRLCDGYFFPINNRSRRRQFYEDAQQCSARCSGSEARLFYLSPSASIRSARDQRGIAYRKLKTAFLYRKKLVKNCACRPQPWSVSERMRHKSYGLVAQNSAAVAELDDASPDKTDAKTKVVAAKPSIVGEGRQAAIQPVEQATAVPIRVPAPRAATRYQAYERAPVARRRNVSRRARRSRRIRKKKWALGASNSPKKAKFSYNWPGDH